MTRSACAAFGGCYSARTSWFPCVLLCVLLEFVSLLCVGRLCALGDQWAAICPDGGETRTFSPGRSPSMCTTGCHSPCV